jgi:hypothetical protein
MGFECIAAAEGQQISLYKRALHPSLQEQSRERLAKSVGRQQTAAESQYDYALPAALDGGCPLDQVH